MKFILENFYSKLEEKQNGCTIWSGAKTSDGYGQLCIKTPGVVIYTHIFAYILYYKKEPTGEVHHKCENKACCNPFHLEDLSNFAHRQKHLREFCINRHKILDVGRVKDGSCRQCYEDRLTKLRKHRRNKRKVNK